MRLTVAFFLHRFFAFYCFKCYLGSFSRWKAVFSPNIIPLNMLNNTKLTRNGQEKKFVFWCESRRAGRSLMIVNKRIKKTQKIWFFSVGSNFISLMSTKICIFTCGSRENTVLMFIRRNKTWSYIEKIKYPLCIKKDNPLSKWIKYAHYLDNVCIVMSWVP